MSSVGGCTEGRVSNSESREVLQRVCAGAVSLSCALRGIVASLVTALGDWGQCASNALVLESC